MASTKTYTTTLVSKVGINDNHIQVASALGITNPDVEGAHESSLTYLQIDQEYMFVDADYKQGSTFVPVIRGVSVGILAQSSNVQSHEAGAVVMVTATDSKEL